MLNMREQWRYWISLRGARFGLAVFAGLLLCGVLNLKPWWPLALVAPVPLLLAALHASSRNEARGLSLLAAGIGLATNFSYFAEVGGGPAFAVLLILLQSLVWTFVVPTAVRVRSAFGYPVAWAASDTVIAALSPHGSALSLAYTQGDNPVIRQLGALTGNPGIVFTIALVPAIIAFAIHNGRVPKAPAAAMAALLAIGLLAKQPPASAETHIKLGLVAIDDFRATPAVWNRYEAAIGELAAQGARIVLLPEKIDVRLSEQDGRQRVARLAEVARQHRIHLVFGLGIEEGGRLLNRAWMLSPQGEITAVYDKQQLVPGLEREYTPGSQDITVEVDGLRFGIAICKDMHFPSLGRRYAGVQAMLVPAWDFDADDWLTERMTAQRGIENGYAIIRSSRQGMLTVSDPNGNRAGHARSSGMPGKTLLVDAPIVRGTPTLYSRFGDWFGWICVAFTAWFRFSNAARKPL